MMVWAQLPRRIGPDSDRMSDSVRSMTPSHVETTKGVVLLAVKVLLISSSPPHQVESRTEPAMLDLESFGLSSLFSVEGKVSRSRFRAVATDVSRL
jgi:hypothetical protein